MRLNISLNISLNIYVRKTKTLKKIILVFSNFMLCRIIQSLFVNTKRSMNTTHFTTKSSINIYLKNIITKLTNETHFKTISLT